MVKEFQIRLRTVADLAALQNAAVLLTKATKEAEATGNGLDTLKNQLALVNAALASSEAATIKQIQQFERLSTTIARVGGNTADLQKRITELKAKLPEEPKAAAPNIFDKSNPVTTGQVFPTKSVAMVGSGLAAEGAELNELRAQLADQRPGIKSGGLAQAPEPAVEKSDAEAAAERVANIELELQEAEKARADTERGASLAQTKQELAITEAEIEGGGDKAKALLDEADAHRETAEARMEDLQSIREWKQEQLEAAKIERDILIRKQEGLKRERKAPESVERAKELDAEMALNEKSIARLKTLTEQPVSGFEKLKGQFSNLRDGVSQFRGAFSAAGGGIIGFG